MKDGGGLLEWGNGGVNIEHSTFNVEVGMMKGHAPSWPFMLDTERSQAGEDRRQGRLRH